MTEKTSDTLEIKDTDIVFDCPHCGKSLAIDYRGAGLIIPCTDCGKHVQVPIPEGMEITDIDSTEEEQEIRILNLRRSLAGAEDRIKELEGEVEGLNTRRESLEKTHSDNIYRFDVVMEKVGLIESTLKELTEAIKDLPDTENNSAQ